MRLILVIGLLSLIVACGSTPKDVASGPATSQDKKLLVDQYYIGVDDIVSVNVWKNPELSITVPVRPDGKISVPLVGEVTAGGKTPVEVADDITNKLAKYIRDPRVAVILNELRSHEFLSRVRVTGAVRSPMSLPFRQGMTVLDVVLEAGGLNEFASANSTRLFRKVDGKVNTIDIELFEILNNGDMATNYSLEPGDILSIPERIF
ncbi:XrtA/PEP-CTERM system exopolysaccharide export protein [Aliikangiella coralliicola]|uniref:Sugar ABC transporter substrate-binding protein n=1 Tax=Aliikangiella coralliicola TaxID=2592383 RepID=A0A545UHD5_9GAMM|nr:XrtA/PEP-CTERM system exopolysaccharide export protein [Aliikangiella coralliicola]TQV88877.1 sugar ABC transporter substrate-binding protein [Aliikangiella coralliicola]